MCDARVRIQVTVLGSTLKNNIPFGRQFNKVEAPQKEVSNVTSYFECYENATNRTHKHYSITTGENRETVQKEIYFDSTNILLETNDHYPDDTFHTITKYRNNQPISGTECGLDNEILAEWTAL